MVSGGGSLGVATLDLSVDDSKFNAGMNRAHRSTRDNLKKMSAVTAGVGVAGVAAFGAMAKSAMTFDQNMREVNSLVGLGAEEFAVLKKETLEVSSAIGIEANQAVQGLYQAISAGIPADNVMTFMETAGKAAIAGVTDIETSVDGLTTVINAFGLKASDAERVADVMFSTVKGGKTTFEELSASMFQVAPIAASMGISLEEVGAATATLTKSGVPTSVAMTQMRSAMVALTKPTENMTGILEELGFSSGQAAIDALGFQGALAAIREKAEASDTSLANVFGRVEAVGAVLGVTGQNAEVFAGDYEAAMNSAGASGEAFALVNEGAGRQLELAIIQLKNMATVIGDAFLPVILKVTQALIRILVPITRWMQENPKLLQTIALVGGGVSVLMALVGSLGLALFAIGPAIPALGVAFGLLLGPLGLVILAIGALATAIATDFLGIRTALGNLRDLFTLGFSAMGRVVRHAGRVMVAGLTKVVDALELLGNFLSNLTFPVFHELAEVAGDAFADVRRAIAQGDWTGALETMGSAIGDAFSVVMDAVATFGGDLLKALSDALSHGMVAFRDALPRWQSAAADLATGFGSALVNGVRELAPEIAQRVRSLGEAIRDGTPTVLSRARELGSGIVSTISGAIEDRGPDVIARASELGSNIMAAIGTGIERASEAVHFEEVTRRVKTFGEVLREELPEPIDGAIAKIGDLSKAAREKLSPALKDAAKDTNGWRDSLGEDLQEGLKKVREGVGKLRGEAVEFSEGSGPLNEELATLNENVIKLASGDYDTTKEGLDGIREQFIGKEGLVEQIPLGTGVMAGLGLRLLGLTGPVGAAVTLIAGLALAWETDFMGIRTATTKTWDETIKPKLQEWIDALTRLGDTNEEQTDRIAKDMGAMGIDVGIETTEIGEAFTDLRDTADRTWKEIAKTTASEWENIKRALELPMGLMTKFAADQFDEIILNTTKALDNLLIVIGIGAAALRLDWSAMWKQIKILTKRNLGDTWGEFIAFKDDMIRTWNNLSQGIKDIVDDIISTVNDLIRGWNRLSFKVPEVKFPDFGGLNIEGFQVIPGFTGPTLGGKTIDFPYVPTLDTGGLVEGPGVFAVGPGVKEVVRESEAGRGVTIQNLNVYNPEGSLLAQERATERMLRRVALGMG